MEAGNRLGPRSPLEAAPRTRVGAHSRAKGSFEGAGLRPAAPLRGASSFANFYLFLSVVLTRASRAPGASHQAATSIFCAASRTSCATRTFGPSGQKTSGVKALFAASRRTAWCFAPGCGKPFYRASRGKPGASHQASPAPFKRGAQVPSAPACGKHFLRCFARYARYAPFRAKARKDVLRLMSFGT